MTDLGCPSWCENHPDDPKKKEQTHWGPVHRFGVEGLMWAELAHGQGEPKVVIVPTPEAPFDLPLPSATALASALGITYGDGLRAALSSVFDDLSLRHASNNVTIDIPFTLDGDTTPWFRSDATACGATDDKSVINVFLLTDDPGDHDPDIFIQAVGSMNDDPNYDNVALQIGDPDVADRLASALTLAAHQLRQLRKEAWT